MNYYQILHKKKKVNNLAVVVNTIVTSEYSMREVGI